MPRRWPWALAIAAAGGTAWLAYGIYTPKPIKVIDGDTVERGGVRHRLKGYDAPEIRQAKCPAEKKRGVTARARLEQLIATAKTTHLAPGLKLEKYGRMLSTLTIDGEDVAAIAVREGWGMRFNGGREPRPDWCFAKLPPVATPGTASAKAEQSAED